MGCRFRAFSARSRRIAPFADEFFQHRVRPCVRYEQAESKCVQTPALHHWDF